MGAFFAVGEQKIRPGAYIRYENTGRTPEAILQQGICAAVFKADWGPLGVVSDITADNKDRLYGSALTTDIMTEILNGGASAIKGVRLGTGGTKGIYTIRDTAVEPVSVISITAKYEGTKPLKLTLRDSLTDSSKRELLVYDGVVFRQKFMFDKGGAEVDALIAAITADGSDWITASKLANGNGILEALNQQPLTGGANPTITSQDYSEAFVLLESQPWNVLAVDTEDTAVHALVQGYIDRILSDGKFVLGVIGEPTTVDFSTRKENAAAFNDYAILYVLNGFKDADGNFYEGYKAAARVAGMVASAAVTSSLTHAIVKRANALTETLTNPQIEQAIQSGAIVFTTNSKGQVQIEYGINTLVSPDSNQDAGWKKIRRVRTRFSLMERVSAAWDDLIGKVDNDPDGRATLVSAAQGVVNKMIYEGALLPGGIVYEDPENPPVGDSAWFKLAVDDIDSGEKLYLSCGFRFAPETTT
ncbi:MAG: phage tail sheath subtilisin-like domain-containing protein [Firmicutes bacterium]|nr:phage tail sheath subtilisin-like domain-containing protein [Bacillota bacterium]